MNIRQILPPLLLLALVTLLAIELPAAIAGRARNYDWFGPVIDARAMLMSSYVENPDEDAMQKAILTALVESLDDPYTIYVPPTHTNEFQKDLCGHYVGIGAHVRGFEGRLKILSPMEGSPALEAGIRSGDLVLQIEDFDTLNQPIQDCIDQLMGEPGSDVEVLVRHSDDEEEQLTITRRAIKAPTTAGLIRRNQAWQHLIDEDRGTAYMRVTQFTQDTVPQMVASLAPLVSADTLNGLILDLRNNPGGALPAAVAMADLFLAEGDIVSIGTDRPERTAERRVYAARRGHPLEDVAVVVLLDESSASASEIVAGALKDNERALIVGERSYGKGSVQEVRPLDGEHGMLKFTTAHYYLPSGRNLHRDPKEPDRDWGVDPSPGCIVAETIEDKLDRLEARWAFEAIMDDEPEVPDSLDPNWLREAMHDPALAEAHALLSHYHDHDAWPELDEDEDVAFPPLQAELDVALDQRESLAKHLLELQDNIRRLRGSEQTVDRGLIGLPDDADVSGAEIVLRDKDGTVLGTWRVAEGENIRASLDAVELEPVDVPQPELAPDAG
ncbi:MAG: S41 family peptidase [Phycisphaerales bacterium]|jgi:carboxyl-terminal processing protease|nr:S41 family peptidase [Phycisphaerales bacterium]